MKFASILRQRPWIILSIILNRPTLSIVRATGTLLPSSGTSTWTPGACRHSSMAMAFASSPSSCSPQKRLVLIGGGHAHIQVIKALNKASRPENLKVILIDFQRSASYSGMVPGTIAGAYKPEETLLHLAPLTEWAGIQFINQKVVDIDVHNNLIYVENDLDNPIPYDALSLDIGSTSRGLYETKGAKDYSIATRPIAVLVQRLQQETELLKEIPRPVDVLVVGGGAAGTELSLSVKGRWSPILGVDNVRVTVLDSNQQLLSGESAANRRALVTVLKEHGIQVKHQCTVKEVREQSLLLTSNEEISFTHCLWATGAGAHDLAMTLANRGLATSKYGWFRVNQNLQSISHPNIFAAGDCCTMEGLENGTPPKAGVYAVRSGPILIENLTRILDLEGTKPLIPYKPQQDYMKLMVCGDGTALGFKYGIPFQGKWVFDLKNEIDTGFMDLFKIENLPELKEGQPYDTSQYDDDSKRQRPEPLPPVEAAILLQRTDDDVDFQQAWSILRHMDQNHDYRQDILDRIPVANPGLIAA